MAIFALKPYQGVHYKPFAAMPEALSCRETEEIIRVGEALKTHPATVAREEGSIVDSAFREARVSWIHPDDSTHTVFVSLARIIEQINSETFKFDLLGFAEPIQYTVYESPSVGYDWHFDMMNAPTEVQRKLSITVQLSDPAEYSGGELELRDGSAVAVAPQARGTVVAFPGWALHRVTPVTQGIRRSLVAWIGGPPFR